MATTTQETARTQAVRGFIWSVLDYYEATGGRGPMPTRIYEEAKRLEPGCELCRGTPGRIRNDTECWRCREEAVRQGEVPSPSDARELLGALGCEVSHG